MTPLTQQGAWNPSSRPSNCRARGVGERVPHLRQCLGTLSWQGVVEVIDSMAPGARGVKPPSCISAAHAKLSLSLPGDSR
jgi:hypothetical protein